MLYSVFAGDMIAFDGISDEINIRSRDVRRRLSAENDRRTKRQQSKELSCKSKERMISRAVAESTRLVLKLLRLR